MNLEEPGNPAHRRLIIERMREFRDIPGVLELQVGPVLPSDRSIVDDGFDVGIVMRVASPEDLRLFSQDRKSSPPGIVTYHRLRRDPVSHQGVA